MIGSIKINTIKPPVDGFNILSIAEKELLLKTYYLSMNDHSDALKLVHEHARTNYIFKQYVDCMFNGGTSNNLLKIAYLGSVPIGLMVGYSDPNEPLCINACNYIYVEPAFRLNGIAKQLCKGLESANISKIESVSNSSPMIKVLGISDPVYFHDLQGDTGEFIYLADRELLERFEPVTE